MGRNYRVALLCTGLAALGLCAYLLLDMERASSELRLAARDSGPPGAEHGGSNPTATMASSAATSDPAQIESAAFDAEADRVEAGPFWSIVALDEAGDPIPDAEITVRVDLGSDLPLLRTLHGASEAQAQPPLVIGRTDAEGVFPVHLCPPVRVEIAAAAGTRRALVVAQPPKQGERIELRLLPPREIRVTLVDEADQPLAGLRVEPLGAVERVLEAATGRTDASGVARLLISGEHAELLAAPDFQLRVQRPEARTFDGPKTAWAPAGVTEARIAMPSQAAVKVTVIDEAGQPVTSTMRILCLPDPEKGRPLDWDGGVRRERSFVGPSVVIAGINSLGPTQFILREAGRLEVRALHVLEAGSPVTEITLRRGPLAPVLSVLLVDPRSQPLGHFACTVELQYDPAATEDPTSAGRRHWPRPKRQIESSEAADAEVFTVRTDERGHLEFPVQPGRAILIRLHRPLEGLNLGGLEDEFFLSFTAWLGAEDVLFQRSIPGLPPGQRMVLEPIAVADLQLVAAGIVVDRAGQPLAGAEVRCFATRRSEGDAATSRAMLETASACRRLVTRTGADGRFEIRGTIPRSELAIAATLGALQTHPVVFAPGAQNLRIRMLPAGSIVGRGILDFAGSDPFLVRAIAEDVPTIVTDALSSARESHIQANSHGPFTIPHLSPGRYTLEFSFRQRELLSIRNVVVRSGQVTRDPRLQDLVLRSDLKEVEFKLIDAQGAPIPDAIVEGRLSVDGRSPRSFLDRTDRFGRLFFFKSKAEVAVLRASKEGFLTGEWIQSKFPFMATLSTGTTLEATIEGLRDLSVAETDHPGFVLELERSPRSAGGESAPSASRPQFLTALLEAPSLRGRIDREAQSTQIRSIAPGTYEVRLQRAPAASAQGAPGSAGTQPPGAEAPRHHVRLGTLVVPEGTDLLRKSFALPQDAKDLLRKSSPAPSPR